MSRTPRFRRNLSHFIRSCNMGKYPWFISSKIYPTGTVLVSSAYCCINLRLKRLRWDRSWPASKGSKRFGFKALGSSKILVDGLLLRIVSTSHITVAKLSSRGFRSFNTTLRTFRDDLITLSQTPPMCGAAGGLQ